MSMMSCSLSTTRIFRRGASLGGIVGIIARPGGDEGKLSRGQFPLGAPSLQQGRERKDGCSVRPLERASPRPEDPVPGEYGKTQRTWHRVAGERVLIDVMQVMSL